MACAAILAFGKESGEEGTQVMALRDMEKRAAIQMSDLDLRRLHR